MIRVRKSDHVPESLVAQKKYGENDVREQLKSDQDAKCYICERNRTTDFEVEHLQSKAKHPELKFDWNNLSFSCSYCNGKKSDSFDLIYSPSEHDVELEIQSTVDLSEEEVHFNKMVEVDGIDTVIQLLTRIYNGTSVDGMRTFNESEFYKEFSTNIFFFIKIVSKYKRDRSNKSKQIVIDELQIDKENLGFKYHILKNIPTLFEVFKEYMVWNRQQAG